MGSLDKCSFLLILGTGNPVDLSGTVVFLASSASDYVTGTGVTVSGIGSGHDEDVDTDGA